MKTLFWSPQAAISADTPFAPPTAVNAPRMIGVVNAMLLPATSAASSNPIQETGVASGAGSGTSGAAGAGQITFDVASQQFTSGDDIATSGVLLISVFEEGDLPYVN